MELFNLHNGLSIAGIFVDPATFWAILFGLGGPIIATAEIVVWHIVKPRLSRVHDRKHVGPAFTDYLANYHGSTVKRLTH